MSKTIKIGGRIESAERGGVVTGANAILDDTKGKKQNVINSEVSDELVRIAGVAQGLSDTIEAILVLIPSAASALNKLADMAFVNSSVSTNTATFRGTSEAGLTEQQFLAWADGLTHDINDYVFWNTVDADGNVQFKRYKYDGTQWLYEYTLNNSSFTAAQWAAINSGITTALVAKLNDLPTNAALQAAFSAITAVIPSDATAENKLTDKAYVDGLIQAIEAIIPAEASSTNKLADKEYVGTEIAAAILAAIPSFKGQFTSLVELQAVQSPKDGDFGIVRTTDKDGRAVYSFYQYKNESWNAYYTLQYQNQRKPASTGLTGNYPSNGMGRIELPRNEVEIYPLNTWGMVVRNGISYLVYSYGFKYYAVYDSVSGKGLGLENNLVSEVANYNIADIADIVETNYLNYSEASGVFTITKPDTTTITSTELNNTELWFWGTDAKSVYNVLTQSMMMQQNTIYVIQYDYELAENVTIPANCVLEFDGGSISGEHTLTGNNTGIQAGLVKIFNTDVTLADSWNIADAYPEWFGAKGDGITDDTNAFNKVLESFHICCISNDNYVCNSITVNDIYLYSNKKRKIYNTRELPTIHVLTGSLMSNIEDVNIENIGFAGNNRETNCIVGINCIRFSIKGCMFRDFNKAIGDYLGVGVIEDSDFCYNKYPIYHVVDTRIINCTINANENGIILGNGAGSNIIMGCRIEWNDHNGIFSYENSYQTIIGNQIDRMIEYGIALWKCKNCIISGNSFRRNGVNNNTQKAQINISTCEKITFTGNDTMAANSLDSGEGINVPKVCVNSDGGNSDILFCGNNLKGYIETVFTGNSTGIKFLDNLGILGNENFIEKKNITLSSITSGTVTFDHVFVQDAYTMPKRYRLVYKTRNSGADYYDYGEVTFITKNQGSLAIVQGITTEFIDQSIHPTISLSLNANNKLEVTCAAGYNYANNFFELDLLYVNDNQFIL